MDSLTLKTEMQEYSSLGKNFFEHMAAWSDVHFGVSDKFLLRSFISSSNSSDFIPLTHLHLLAFGYSSRKLSKQTLEIKKQEQAFADYLFKRSSR